MWAGEAVQGPIVSTWVSFLFNKRFSVKHIANKNIRVPSSYLLLFLNVIKPICWMCYAYMHLSPSPQKQCIFTRAVVVRTTTCLPERKFTVQSGSHESLLPSNQKTGWCWWIRHNGLWTPNELTSLNVWWNLFHFKRAGIFDTSGRDLGYNSTMGKSNSMLPKHLTMQCQIIVSLELCLLKSGN